MPAKPLCSYLEPLPQVFSSQAVDVLRLDKIHPWISGNKFLKLKGWLERYKNGQYQGLISFGGMHSNHLHALAFFAQQNQISLTLFVRGYEQQPTTATIEDCKSLGVRIIYCDKKTYAKRYDEDFLAQLADEYNALVIPEGGAGIEGEIGCHELADIAKAYDEVWLAVGTGTTALGLAKGLGALNSKTLVVGVNAVCDHGERMRAWQTQMPHNINWQLIDDAHFGGFAYFPEQLRSLVHQYDALNLPLDPIYTAKLMHAFEMRAFQLINKRVLLIHTGGLQGRRGVNLAVDDFAFKFAATSLAQ